MVGVRAGELLINGQSFSLEGEKILWMVLVMVTQRWLKWQIVH